jgi:manganese/iron transport system substrate-binding protein
MPPPLAALLATTLLLTSLLSSCAALRPAVQNSPMKVVTSISPLADLIKNVGGERVDVTSLVPRGAGPEDYDPTPADALKIHGARVFFANGLGLEEYLADLVESVGEKQLAVVQLSEGLPTVTSFGHGVQQGGNPHLWLDPRSAIVYVDVIRQTLDRLDPPGAATYDANAAAYTAQLQALDQEIEQKVAQIPPANRILVSVHDAYPYFAQRYGLRYLAVISANPESDPSAQEYAALLQVVRNNQVKAVFGETGFSERFVSQLAADSGATYVADLYTDTLSEGPPADTYLNLMRSTSDAIVGALK